MATSPFPLERLFYLSLPTPSARSNFTRKRNAATAAYKRNYPSCGEQEVREEGWRAAGWGGPWYEEEVEGTQKGGEGEGEGEEEGEKEGEGEGEGREWLVGLNGRQRQAVMHPFNTPLQVLAGPGSGKTSVLTKRVCHMVREQGLSPESIVCVTFTNKAAAEMKERLTKLLGLQACSRLRLGTFHRLSLTYLRASSHLIDIPNNFTVIDTDDAKKICSSICASLPFSARIKDTAFTVDGKVLLDKISDAKSRCIDSEEMRRKGELGGDLPGQAKGFGNREDQWMILTADMMEEYQRVLRKTHSLDFDDLLSECVRLFEAHPHLVSGIRHTFVDEFQDTNTTQYKLMTLMASPTNSVTIVGDPDQSVYGWRAARIENLKFMRKDFPSTTQVLLEQSYRSTKAILSSSLKLISQDTNREHKGLTSKHPEGLRPCLIVHQTANLEAAANAEEIKRIKAHTGLGFADFAILLRYNALSRPLEQALTRERIPSKLIGTVKFFGRAEVKDLMAYLQLVENPFHTPSFERVVNVPNRGFGSRSVETLKIRADAIGISISDLANRIADGEPFELGSALVGSLKSFMGVIASLKRKSQEGLGAYGVLQSLLQTTGYEEYLKRHNPDFESKIQNVQELLTFAHEEDKLFQEAQATNPSTSTPLSSFLECSTLATEAAAADESKGSVTIATIHSAKGLEWPVVFLPGLEEGKMPFFRSVSPEELAEERRLLFVAQTRAQVLLNLSWATTRNWAGKDQPNVISRFLSATIEKNKNEFDPVVPTFTAQARADISKVLNRNPFSEEEIALSVAAFDESKIARPSNLMASTSSSHSSSFPNLARFPSTPYASSSQGNKVGNFKTPLPLHLGGQNGNRLDYSSSPAQSQTPEQGKEERLRIAREKKERFAEMAREKALLLASGGGVKREGESLEEGEGVGEKKMRV